MIPERVTRTLAQGWDLLRRCPLVLGMLAAGILLLTLPAGGSRHEADPPPAVSGFDLAATEQRLSAALSKIDGAGEVTVVLTVRDGPKTVLAQNTDTGQAGEEKRETVVLSKGGGAQETVPVQERYPAYQGALLICPGGEDPQVRFGLTQAVSALTGLGADKIAIRKGT